MRRAKEAGNTFKGRMAKHREMKAEQKKKRLLKQKNIETVRKHNREKKSVLDSNLQGHEEWPSPTEVAKETHKAIKKVLKEKKPRRK